VRTTPADHKRKFAFVFHALGTIGSPGPIIAEGGLRKIQGSLGTSWPNSAACAT
jgi:hypothetical protein